MMKQVLLSLMCILLLGTVVLAAPALLITKPPVQPVPSYTGPVLDPHAIQGQWFKDLTTGHQHAKPYEFYDNVIGYGGGDIPDPAAFDSWRAIYGKVTNVTMSEGVFITAFTIKARITNDDAWVVGPWAPGTNRHSESLETTEKYVCPLIQTKLTASFAISALGNIPSSWTGAYLQGIQPYIIADNEDELAWYSWTPNNPDPEKTPWGNYFVPTWDFGDIPHGEYAERDLMFSVPDGGLVPSDPRSATILESLNASWGDGDVFTNRTTSLKLSDWVEDLDSDPGTPYPGDPDYLYERGSDVSVFFTPEPGTLALLGLGALTLLRRRRA